ncbi:hypothetical protein [Paenibacillus crassostreae]|uniref:PilZ domain-containing protein n=1 Tax=Paenibacillus crassostreae TaxID=1763538 RepID=A0A167AHQ0_9BACL|nr:hypothetical protein [Paenibacillus crassostreae]AOZ92321.1 hypothetical protein LPB68_08825 [Paenibacillus crassostreae]OAB71036.1 hypothetical protein PNBC_20975 [Paenibacillus crassostreae]
MKPNIHDWANLTLNAHLYIREVRGVKVNSKRRPIFLMELGDNTIGFLSDLDLPMFSYVVYGFEIENNTSKVILTGNLIAKGIYEHRFQYRVDFHNAKENQLYNKSLLKKMLIHLDYFLTSKHKQTIHKHKYINVFF